jgi:hypothetical protein
VRGRGRRDLRARSRVCVAVCVARCVSFRVSYIVYKKERVLFSPRAAIFALAWAAPNNGATYVCAYVENRFRGASCRMFSVRKTPSRRTRGC